MAGIKGKQIATGANGVATANLNDGILANSTDGRKKIATGFFNDGTAVADKFAAGSFDSTAVSAVVASGAIAPAKLALDSAFAFTGGVTSSTGSAPSLSTELVTKAYVDNSKTFGSPVSVGTVSADGTSTDAARADHVHASPVIYSGDKARKPTGTTSGNYSSTGLTLSMTPGLDGDVAVFVNGVEVPLNRVGGTATGRLDGVTANDGKAYCYFSSNGGTTAKAVSDFVAGDTLYWNGGVAGYDVVHTGNADLIDFVYAAFSPNESPVNGGGGGGSTSVFDRDVTAATVSNSSTENTVYTVAVPGGQLGTNGRLELALRGAVSTLSSSPGTVTVRFKYGSAVLPFVVDLAPGASSAPIRLEADVTAAGVSNSQVLHAAYQDGASLSSELGRATGSVDSTASQTLAVTVQFSVANAANSFTFDSCFVRAL